jgi:hypothetical protein
MAQVVFKTAQLLVIRWIGHETTTPSGGLSTSAKTDSDWTLKVPKDLFFLFRFAVFF